MFIESGIVSEGSIKGVLSGKHYNRYKGPLVYQSMIFKLFYPR